MRTVRCSSHLEEGGCLPGGVGSAPWTECLTHAYKNITFPQLRFEDDNKGNVT